MADEGIDVIGGIPDDDLAGDALDTGIDGYDNLSDLTLSDEDLYEGYGEDDEDDATVEAIPRQEQVRMIHLRKYLDHLTDQSNNKEYVVEKTREELKKCRDRVEQLEGERNQVFTQIQEAENKSNTSSVYRLRAQHERVCEELENEQDLEAKINAALQHAQYELAQAQVEQGKYILADHELQQKEDQWQRERTDMADLRKKKEHEMANQADKRKKMMDRQREESFREQERKQQHAIQEAKKSRDKHNKFLKETMEKLRRRESQEEIRQKEHMEKRMKTMLALKTDITANRENLRALQARDRAFSNKQKEEENKQKQEILSVGGNPEEEMIKQRRIEEFEKEREQFSAKQRERQVEIAGRLLQEEERMKKRMQQQPYLYTDPKKEKAKIVKQHKKRKLQVFEMYKDSLEKSMVPPGEEDCNCHPTSPTRGMAADDSPDEEGYNPYKDSLDDAYIPDSSDEEMESSNLAKPEFEGMWKEHKPYKVPKDIDCHVKLPGASKMDKEILGKVLEKHREGIVIKQVAGGKEFKGRAFYSKPDLIHFKDFDVGKTYKKKVTLTNVSYTVNYCKLTGITEHLKDFISVHFDPPGQMSAGLTCEMLVTFKPMINEDLEGEVSFLAQTGPFSIPISCTTKKCDLRVDNSLIEYGTTVIGETLKKSFTLINQGALATQYDFYKLTGLKLRTLTTAETSLGRLTSTDTAGADSPVSESDQKGKGSKDSKKGGKKLPKKEEKISEPEEEKTEEVDKTEDDSKAAEAGEGADENIEDSTSDLSVEMEELQSLDGMTVGPVSSGMIGAHSTVRLEIIWQPTIPGQVDTEFLIAFQDPLSENISVQAVGNAVDVPVWVERQNIDLKICMFDRLYQDTIVVNNRATTALRLKFEVCKELRNHLELLPKTGYIQAQSQFSAQLKFLPRHSLLEEAGKYFDKETGVLQAPMTIRVADQTRPVPFMVHAVVTTSDLHFDVENIDFGKCTIHEAVKTTVKLTNNSILPQKFGFVGIPDYVEVQPNDGFGTLLPLETLELDIIFKPSRARDYSFELTCKSLINREFKIYCKGVGVHTPLELTKQVLHFSATALYDVSTAALHVVNTHTDMNEFTHPVPRIGKGEIAPVGPTSFEFVVPEDAPITVSPSVGTVMPGKKALIQVRFTPVLLDVEVRKEAVRMVTRTLEARAQEEYKQALQREKENQEQAQKGASKKPPAKGKASPKGARGKAGDSNTTVSVKGPAPVQAPTVENIDPLSDEYAAAKASLLRQFKGKFETIRIPCYIASGKCANPGVLPYSIHNTLHMEVHCPTVKPELVVISDNGRTSTEFGDVSIGQSIIKSVTIQNISQRNIDLRSSLLDTAGPFQMLNALRLLPPDASHTLLVCFTPHKGQVFQEVQEIKSPTATLFITLKGKGVSPVVSLSIKDGEMDMGALIAGEYKEETFKIVNTSSLAVQYSIKLDSQSLLRHSKAQALPSFINKDAKHRNLVGTQNLNGQQVFDCVPAEGVIAAGGSRDILVTFAPDHTSDYFSDGCRIELFGQEENHVFRVFGESKKHIMYMSGGDELTPDVESLAIQPALEEDEGALVAKPLLVTLHSVSKENEFTTATREINVGCVRTMAVSQKKNGEWLFDSLTAITPFGFNIDPIKGMIEAGTRRGITITWTPPPGHDPNKTVEANINATLTGDVKETITVMLRAMVVSE